MSWPRLEVVRVVTVFDTNGNRGKECERLGKITERKGFENQFLTLQCTAFGEILGTLQAHARKTAKLGTFEMCLQCSQNFPKFSQKQYTAGTLPGHCKCTDVEHLWYIPLVLSKFPSLVHCDHTDGNTANSLQMSHSGTSLVLSLENLKVYPQFT